MTRRLLADWGTVAAVALLSVAALATLRLFDPNRPGNPFPACPFLAVTGLYCPGCGSTRSLHALAHLDLATALAMNPLLVLSLPALAILVLGTSPLRRLLPGPVMRAIGDPRAWLWILVSYWVLRNLPWPPFAWLAPGSS